MYNTNAIYVNVSGLMNNNDQYIQTNRLGKITRKLSRIKSHTGSSITARFRFSYRGIPYRETPSLSDPRTAADLPGAE